MRRDLVLSAVSIKRTEFGVLEVMMMLEVELTIVENFAAVGIARPSQSFSFVLRALVYS